MFYLYKPVIAFAAICTVKGGVRGEKPFMYAFALAYISTVTIKRYKQDLTLEVITFASGSGEKYAFFYCLVPK